MMTKGAKLALQLAGLTVWATAWIGGGLLLLKRAIDKDEAQMKKDREEREARRAAKQPDEPESK